MYIRVKKDSVTSILLFIFNVFLVGRNVYSVPLKKIFKLLEPFQKSETSIRMGLSRGVQNGLFINERKGQEVYYRLSDEAVHSLRYWQQTLTRFQDRIKMQYSNWDGNWNIVLLNLTSREKVAGYVEEFVQSLEQAGYGKLNKEQWISPYDLSSEVIKLAQKHGLSKDILVFLGKPQNKKPDAFASEVWPIKELAQRYRKYAQKMHKAAGGLHAKSSNFGQILVFLYLFGSELFEIIQDDPQLPLVLLPADWQGIKAARSFGEIREKVLPKANTYIDDIFNE